MWRKQISGIGFTAGVLAIVLLAGTASAQQRSIRITDGNVYIDGRLVQSQELPSGLQTEGMEVHYSFSGDVRPIVQLGGEFYILDGEALRVANMDERGGASFFGGDSFMSGFTPPDVQVDFRTEPPLPDHAVLFERKAQELMQQAQRMQELQQDIQQQAQRQARPAIAAPPQNELRELEALVEEMSLHAVEAARVAGDLPRVERESYLNDIQQMNEALFDQLVNERDMEHETLEMAARIRNTADADERDRLTEELRSQLNKIFDLKQENRRREVEQLERRLEDLQQKLEERERLRADIVDHRLRELLGRGPVQW